MANSSNLGLALRLKGTFDNLLLTALEPEIRAQSYRCCLVRESLWRLKR